MVFPSFGVSRQRVDCIRTEGLSGRTIHEPPGPWQAFKVRAVAPGLARPARRERRGSPGSTHGLHKMAEAMVDGCARAAMTGRKRMRRGWELGILLSVGML